MNRDLWDTIMHTNICIMVPEEKERARGAERTFKEIMAKNFPNFDKRLETQQIPSRTQRDQ